MSEPLSLQTVLKKSADVAYRIWDDQAMGVVLSAGRSEVLNRTATTVWEQIDGQRTLGEILETVLDQYDVPREQAEADLLELAVALSEHGWVS